MKTVQLALRNAMYAERLQNELEASGHCRILRVETPDLKKDGVIVLDSDNLEAMPWPLPNPERFVLVTANDPLRLACAWERGIISVVYETDALQTALLAIMATCLRTHRARSVSHQCVISPRAQRIMRAVPQPLLRKPRGTFGL